MTQIFLLAGTTSFPDPGNWDSVNNKVECLGPGATGAGAHIVPHSQDAPVLLATVAGAGGGGGGYGWATSLNPAFPVPVNIGTQATPSGDPTHDTWWFTYAVGGVNVPGSVIGYGGQNSIDAVQAGPGGSFYPQGFRGGDGGTGGDTDSGSGGGGAAGPNGGGGFGQRPSGPEAQPGGFGGAAMSGLPSGGYGGNSGGAGGNGTFWDASHGPGGGGGGGSGSLAGPFPAGGGGNYGGGGGGSGANNSARGLGAPGLLIITYTPYVQPSVSAQFVA